MKHGLNKAEENRETSLAPCPFCGSADIKLAYRAPFRLIKCFGCGVEVGILDRVDTFIEDAWNHRVQGSGK